VIIVLHELSPISIFEILLIIRRINTKILYSSCLWRISSRNWIFYIQSHCYLIFCLS
jgi:hypothetical protein